MTPQDPLRYLDLFVSESRDHIGAAWACLARLGAGSESGGEPAGCHDMLRHAHSLKGMAATMGYEPMVELAHALEDLFEELAECDTRPPVAAATLVQDGLSCLSDIVDAIEARSEWEAERPRRLAAALRRLEPAARAPATARGAGPMTREPDEARRPRARFRVTVTLRPADEDVGSLMTALREIANLGSIERVDPPHLRRPGRGRRIGLVVESALTEPALRVRLGAIPGVARHTTRSLPARRPATAPAAADRWTRVRTALLDDLLERTVDLILEQGRARAALPPGTSRSGEHLDRASVLVRDLYATVNEIRLVPFDSEAHRLRRTVHEVARTLGRQVRFDVIGGSMPIDRALLDALVDPLAHALRNAVDHGLEPPAERGRLGKPAEGRVEVRLARDGAWIGIEVTDDGRGIDAGAIRCRAVDVGLITPDEARRLGERESLLLVTRPGFSTADEVTRVSGRGLGMDVVRAGVESVGGRLAIRTTPGAGTVVRLAVPADVTLIRALLVRSGSGLFALPLATVRRAGATSASTVPLEVRIAASCGAPLPSSDDAARSEGLVVDRPGGALELGVGEIVGPRQVVVRPLLEPLGRLSCYAGAALLDDGHIALVVDPYHL